MAHEINNPLAIINEKAGLISDLFTFREEYAHDERLLSNIRSIIESVARCGRITKRLLSFARHIDMELAPIRFKDLAEEVVDFLRKEAEYRSITIDMDIPENLPEFVSDRGKLQQIFLNLVNNAFQAMNDGGHLGISARQDKDGDLVFACQRRRVRHPEADQKRIFDPFFSHQEEGGRHRARPVHHFRPGPGAGRLHGPGQRSGQGHHIHHNHAPQRAPEGLRKMKILLVDDEVELVSAMAERLGFRGMDADWTGNAEDALVMAGKTEYDVAVLST